MSTNMDLSLQNKNAKGKLVDSGQRKMIINVHKEMKNQHPDLKYNNIIELVMTVCGVGRRTVVETISHYKKTGNVYSPSKKRVKKTAITELREEEIYAIRKHIDAFWERRELPTLAKILVSINEDINIPNMSMTTLRRVMKKMKFKYMQRKVSLIANTFSPKKK